MQTRQPGHRPDRRRDVEQEKHHHEHSGERFYRYERRFGSFARSVSLPAGVDEDSITASFRDGVVRTDHPVERRRVAQEELQLLPAESVP